MITVTISKKRLYMSLLIIVAVLVSIWGLATVLHRNAYLTQGYISDADQIAWLTHLLEENSIPYKITTVSDGYEYSIKRKDEGRYIFAVSQTEEFRRNLAGSDGLG